MKRSKHIAEQGDGLERFLRTGEVTALLGISRVTLWSWRRRGVFPQPVRMGTATLAWRLSDVVAWQRERPVVGSVGVGEDKV